MKTLAIQRQWCKGCRVCVVFCPKQVLDIDEEGKVYAKHLEKCIYCKLCELRCPDLAIEVQETDDAAGSDSSASNGKRKKAKA